MDETAKALETPILQLVEQLYELGCSVNGLIIGVPRLPDSPEEGYTFATDYGDVTIYEVS